MRCGLLSIVRDLHPSIAPSADALPAGPVGGAVAEGFDAGVKARRRSMCQTLAGSHGPQDA
jgi:hypothetical protein